MEGRGAWTTRGKGNEEKLYTRLPHAPRDGADPNSLVTEEELNWYKCVNRGVTAIQRKLGIESPSGHYGWSTARKVKEFQNAKGLYADGVVGPITAEALLRPVILGNSKRMSIHPRWIFGLARQESGLDPGAQGWSTPADSGIWQFNTEYFPIEDAFNIDIAANQVCKRWSASWVKYHTSNDQLRTDCCIIQHRSPAAADHLFATGNPYNDSAKEYVDSVRSLAGSW